MRVITPTATPTPSHTATPVPPTHLQSATTVASVERPSSATVSPPVPQGTDNPANPSTSEPAEGAPEVPSPTHTVSETNTEVGESAAGSPTTFAVAESQKSESEESRDAGVSQPESTGDSGSSSGLMAFLLGVFVSFLMFLCALAFFQRDKLRTRLRSSKQ